jgi:hypothetical protein
LAALGQCPKLRAQQLVLHAEFADALHGCRELVAGSVRLTLLEGALEGSLGFLAPVLELENRHAAFAGEEFDGLATVLLQLFVVGATG